MASPAYLQGTPPASPPPLNDNQEDEQRMRAQEYQHFLLLLNNDNAGLLGRSSMDLTLNTDPSFLDDDNDADFDYFAEAAKDTDEVDEYRNDRAVHVSSMYHQIFFF